MDYNVTLIPGDGIGPEIVREAKKVMDRVGEVYGHCFQYKEILMGGCSLTHMECPLQMRRWRLPERVTQSF